MVAANKDSMLLKALEQYRAGDGSIAKCAKDFGVAASTMKDRLKGKMSKSKAHILQQKLSEVEEECLMKWIERLAKWGFPAPVYKAVEMAEWILNSRNGEEETKPVRKQKLGVHWFDRFKSRHPHLETFYSQSMDAVRATHNNVEIIHHFFALYKETLEKYKIKKQNIWNMDEKGYMIGMPKKHKVVAPKIGRGKAKSTRDGNRETVTTIECISGTGRSIAPMVIYKAKTFIQRYVDVTSGPEYAGWNFGTSPAGWTDTELTLSWLVKNFDQFTKPADPEQYRLLLIDGHGSHTGIQFIDYCLANKIVALCLPAHSTHLVQPLDVGVFSSCTTNHSQMMERQFQLSGEAVNKETFLTMLPTIRNRAIRRSTILSGFRKSGLIPFNPTVVLDQLAGKPTVDIYAGTADDLSIFDPQGLPKTPKCSRTVDMLCDDIIRNANMTPGSTGKFLKIKKFAHVKNVEVRMLGSDVTRMKESLRNKRQKKEGDQRSLSMSRVFDQTERGKAAERELRRKTPKKKATLPPMILQ